ncbi:MAG: aminotransferase class III-fold pyridoxal phosphate-dependent enzyme [Thermoleophilia bacterium]
MAIAADQETAFWHPFADMGAVKSNEFVLTRGEGSWLWDDQGRKFIDASAALWYVNVGHGRAEIADAAAAQLKKLASYSCFGDGVTEPTRELAAKLADLSGLPGARVFFNSGGSDAVETTAKLARLFHDAHGNGQRTEIISRTNAYHGTHGYGTSLGGIDPNRVGWGQLMPGITHVEHDSVAALEETIAKAGADNVAAFIFEPVIGAGGVLPPSEGYVEGVAELCRSQGILLIVDSTICGMGRIGTWYGFERFGIEPDMVIFAKGVTSGYLPLGGVVVHGRVAEPFWSAPGRMVRHGNTYSGHAACCAAGLANIEIMERENLVPRGMALEGTLYDALAPLADHPLVSEVRGGTGLMAAVELKPEVIQANPKAVGQAYVHTREAGGVLVRPLVRSIAVSPPLIITEDEIAQIGDGIRAGLDSLLAASA